MSDRAALNARDGSAQGAEPGRCSVVIPAFNAAAFIGATVESALAQTHEDVEIIVVDDGSVDETAAVLEPYLDRLCCIRTGNAGVGAARNVGIAAATGEFVAFLDADDLFLPERLQRCVHFLTTHPHVDAVSTDAFLLYDEGPSAVRLNDERRERRWRMGPSQLKSMVHENFLWSAAVVRARAFDVVGTFNPDSVIQASADYDMWLRLLCADSNVALIDEPLGYYRKHAGQMSGDHHAQLMAHTEVLARNPEAFTKAGADGLSKVAWRVARHLAADSRHWEAARFYWLATRDGEARLHLRARFLARAVLAAVAWAIPVPSGRRAPTSTNHRSRDAEQRDD